MGKTQNLDFFYSSGSLSDKDIAKRVFHVIKSLEAIDCRVHGLVSDAGGNNAKLYALLREHLTEEGLWADPGLVSFMNPVEPTRRIWLWYCTTHLLKALRNQLLASKRTTPEIPTWSPTVVLTRPDDA